MTPLEKLAVLRDNTGHKPEFIEARFEHCRERMAERFNISMTRLEYDELNLAIFTDASGCSWLDMGDTMGSSVYRLSWRGRDMLVAFSETAYVMMTVFPVADARLRFARMGTYEVKAQSDADLQYRNERQAIAEQLNDLEPDGSGRLILAVEPCDPPAAQPVAASPFAEALRDFRPQLPAPFKPTLSVVPPANADPVSSEAAAAFAQLNKRLDEQAATLDAEQGEQAAEVERLERRLAELRQGDPVLVMKRGIVTSTREQVEAAFRGWREGAFDAASALSTAQLFLAQQPAEKEPPRQATVFREVRAPGKRGKRGAYAGDVPDVTIVKDGLRLFFRHEGETKSLADWAKVGGVTEGTVKKRLLQGQTFAQAISR